jgi:hypothetical protein
MTDPAYFTSPELRILLDCQEYPEGAFAMKIEAELMI